MPKKKNFRRKSSGLKNLKKQVKEIKKIVKADRGVIDNEVNISSAYQASYVFGCFTTLQGADNPNRSGDTITAQSISLNGLIRKEASATFGETTNQVRLLAVQYESYSDAVIDQVLQYDGTLVLGKYYRGVYSPYKVAGDCKYKVLFDKVYRIPTTREFALINEHIKIPKSSQIMKYTATTSQIPRTNCVIIWTVSDSTVANHPTVEMNIRQRFNK